MSYVLCLTSFPLLYIIHSQQTPQLHSGDTPIPLLYIMHSQQTPQPHSGDTSIPLLYIYLYIIYGQQTPQLHNKEILNIAWYTLKYTSIIINQYYKQQAAAVATQQRYEYVCSLLNFIFDAVQSRKIKL